MWLLLIVISPYGGNYVSTTTVLTFTSEKACMEAKAKVEAMSGHYKAECFKQ